MSESQQAPAGLEATKHDAGKPRLDLLPFDALEVVGLVLARGSVKYGDRNWELGRGFGRDLGASLRHTFAWAQGEDDDPETGLPHLAHACCGLLFLLSFQLRGIGRDDRK